MDCLHYKGNQDLDTEHLYGPDKFGAGYYAVRKEYDEKNDITTLFFQPQKWLASDTA